MTDAGASPGANQERLAALRRRWEEDRSSRVFLQLAEEYRRLGRLTDAVEVLESGLAAQPGYLGGLVALGRCRIEMGDHAGAVETLSRVIAQDPTQLVATKLLVQAQLGLEHGDAARDLLERYELLNGADPEIPALRARLDALRTATAQQPELAVEPVAAEPLADTSGEDSGVEPTAVAPWSEILEQAHAAALHPDARGSETAAAAGDSAAAAGDLPAAVETEAASGAPEPHGVAGVVFPLPPIRHAAPDLAAVKPRAAARGRRGALRDPFPQLATATATARPRGGDLFVLPLAAAAAPAVADLAPTPPSSAAPAAIAEPVPEPIAASVEPVAEPIAAAPFDSVPEPMAEASGEPAAVAEWAEPAAIEEPAPPPPFDGLAAAEVVPELSVEAEPAAWSEPPVVAEEAFAGAGSVPATPDSEVEVSHAEAIAPAEAPAGVAEAASEPDADETAPSLTALAEPSPAMDDLAAVAPASEIAAMEMPRPAESAPAWDAAPPPEAAGEALGAVFAEPEPLSEPAPEVVPPLEEPVLAAGEPPAQAEPAEVPAPPAVTATLGELYLRQGHLDEAEAIFREVLAGQPGNAAAAAGLADVARRRARPLDARELLAGFRGPGGLSAKKSHVLQSYLSRLRQGA